MAYGNLWENVTDNRQWSSRLSWRLRDALPVNLKPDPVAALLREVIGTGRDLFTLPDLRRSPAVG
jgi:hypothetical protein